MDESDVVFDVDGIRVGLGIAIQTIGKMIELEGDPTTGLERLSEGLRWASVNIGKSR